MIIKQNGQSDRQAGVAYANLLLTTQGQELITNAGFLTLPIARSKEILKSTYFQLRKILASTVLPRMNMIAHSPFGYVHEHTRYALPLHS